MLLTRLFSINLKILKYNPISNKYWTIFKAQTAAQIQHDIRFELYTPKNPKQAQILQLNNQTSLKQSNFNPQNPTRVLLHGWKGNGLLGKRFADAYFDGNRHNVNFISVVWNVRGSGILNYFTSRLRCPAMGEHLAKFIDFLAETGGISLGSVTLIGFSLGAHIAGIGEFWKILFVLVQ